MLMTMKEVYVHMRKASNVLITRVFAIPVIIRCKNRISVIYRSGGDCV